MKKSVSLLPVSAVTQLGPTYVLVKLQLPQAMDAPAIRPGQFVEILVKNSPSTFLRRPISVNFVDLSRHELWLLVHVVGEGTRALSRLMVGDTLDCVLPLGNGFTLPEKGAAPRRYLLAGGGVGTAPLLYLGKLLSEMGHSVTFLLGGRTAADVLQLDDFRKYGEVCVTTNDGSLGEQGFVTQHSVLVGAAFDSVATCGPKPMMVAVARLAEERGWPCEASLENLMACGLGACLCCVEKTADGHNVCVCKEGPVFDIKRLSWLS